MSLPPSSAALPAGMNQYTACQTGVRSRSTWSLAHRCARARGREVIGFPASGCNIGAGEGEASRKAGSVMRACKRRPEGGAARVYFLPITTQASGLSKSGGGPIGAQQLYTQTFEGIPQIPSFPQVTKKPGFCLHKKWYHSQPPRSLNSNVYPFSLLLLHICEYLSHTCISLICVFNP